VGAAVRADRIRTPRFIWGSRWTARGRQSGTAGAAPGGIRPPHREPGGPPGPAGPGRWRALAPELAAAPGRGDGAGSAGWSPPGVRPLGRVGRDARVRDPAGSRSRGLPGAPADMCGWLSGRLSQGFP